MRSLIWKYLWLFWLLMVVVPMPMAAAQGLAELAEHLERAIDGTEQERRDSLTTINGDPRWIETLNLSGVDEINGHNIPKMLRRLVEDVGNEKLEWNVHRGLIVSIALRWYRLGAPIDQQFYEDLLQQLNRVAGRLANADQPGSPVYDETGWRGMIATLLRQLTAADHHLAVYFGLENMDEKLRVWWKLADAPRGNLIDPIPRMPNSENLRADLLQLLEGWVENGMLPRAAQISLAEGDASLGTSTLALLALAAATTDNQEVRQRAMETLRSHLKGGRVESVWKGIRAKSAQGVEPLKELQRLIEVLGRIQTELGELRRMGAKRHTETIQILEGILYPIAEALLAGEVPAKLFANTSLKWQPSERIVILEFFDGLGRDRTFPSRVTAELQGEVLFIDKENRTVWQRYHGTEEEPIVRAIDLNASYRGLRATVRLQDDLDGENSERVRRHVGDIAAGDKVQNPRVDIDTRVHFMVALVLAASSNYDQAISQRAINLLYGMIQKRNRQNMTLRQMALDREYPFLQALSIDVYEILLTLPHCRQHLGPSRVREVYQDALGLLDAGMLTRQLRNEDSEVRTDAWMLWLAIIEVGDELNAEREQQQRVRERLVDTITTMRDSPYSVAAEIRAKIENSERSDLVDAAGLLQLLLIAVETSQTTVVRRPLVLELQSLLGDQTTAPVLRQIADQTNYAGPTGLLLSSVSLRALYVMASYPYIYAGDRTKWAGDWREVERCAHQALFYLVDAYLRNPKLFIELGTSRKNVANPVAVASYLEILHFMMESPERLKRVTNQDVTKQKSVTKRVNGRDIKLSLLNAIRSDVTVLEQELEAQLRQRSQGGQSRQTDSRRGKSEGGFLNSDFFFGWLDPLFRWLDSRQELSWERALSEDISVAQRLSMLNRLNRRIVDEIERATARGGSLLPNEIEGLIDRGVYPNQEQMARLMFMATDIMPDATTGDVIASWLRRNVDRTTATRSQVANALHATIVETVINLDRYDAMPDGVYQLLTADQRDRPVAPSLLFFQFYQAENWRGLEVLFDLFIYASGHRDPRVRYAQYYDFRSAIEIFSGHLTDQRMASVPPSVDPEITDEKTRQVVELWLDDVRPESSQRKAHEVFSMFFRRILGAEVPEHLQARFLEFVANRINRGGRVETWRGIRQACETVLAGAEAPMQGTLLLRDHPAAEVRAAAAELLMALRRSYDNSEDMPQQRETVRRIDVILAEAVRSGRLEKDYRQSGDRRLLVVLVYFAGHMNDGLREQSRAAMQRLGIEDLGGMRGSSYGEVNTIRFEQELRQRLEYALDRENPVTDRVQVLLGLSNEADDREFELSARQRLLIMQTLQEFIDRYRASDLTLQFTPVTVTDAVSNVGTIREAFRQSLNENLDVRDGLHLEFLLVLLTAFESKEVSHPKRVELTTQVILPLIADNSFSRIMESKQTVLVKLLLIDCVGRATHLATNDRERQLILDWLGKAQSHLPTHSDSERRFTETRRAAERAVRVLLNPEANAKEKQDAVVNLRGLRVDGGTVRELADLFAPALLRSGFADLHGDGRGRTQRYHAAADLFALLTGWVADDRGTIEPKINRFDGLIPASGEATTSDVSLPSIPALLLLIDGNRFDNPSYRNAVAQAIEFYVALYERLPTKQRIAFGDALIESGALSHLRNLAARGEGVEVAARVVALFATTYNRELHFQDEINDGPQRTNWVRREARDLLRARDWLAVVDGMADTRSPLLRSLVDFLAVFVSDARHANREEALTLLRDIVRTDAGGRWFAGEFRYLEGRLAAGREVTERQLRLIGIGRDLGVQFISGQRALQLLIERAIDWMATQANLYARDIPIDSRSESRLATALRSLQVRLSEPTVVKEMSRALLDGRLPSPRALPRGSIAAFELGMLLNQVTGISTYDVEVRDLASRLALTGISTLVGSTSPEAYTRNIVSNPWVWTHLLMQGQTLDRLYRADTLEKLMFILQELTILSNHQAVPYRCREEAKLLLDRAVLVTALPQEVSLPPDRLEESVAGLGSVKVLVSLKSADLERATAVLLLYRAALNELRAERPLPPFGAVHQWVMLSRGNTASLMAYGEIPGPSGSSQHFTRLFDQPGTLTQLMMRLAAADILEASKGRTDAEVLPLREAMSAGLTLVTPSKDKPNQEAADAGKTTAGTEPREEKLEVLPELPKSLNPSHPMHKAVFELYIMYATSEPSMRDVPNPIAEEGLDRAKWEAFLQRAIETERRRLREERGASSLRRSMRRHRIKTLRQFLRQSRLLVELFGTPVEHMYNDEVKRMRAGMLGFFQFDPDNPIPRGKLTKIMLVRGGQTFFHGFICLKIAQGFAKAALAITEGDISNMIAFFASFADAKALGHFAGFVLVNEGAKAVYDVTIANIKFMRNRPTFSAAASKAFSLSAAMAIMDAVTLWLSGHGDEVLTDRFAVSASVHPALFLGGEYVMQYAVRLTIQSMRHVSKARALAMAEAALLPKAAVLAAAIYLAELADEYHIAPWQSRDLLVDAIDEQRDKTNALFAASLPADQNLKQVAVKERQEALLVTLLSFKTYERYLTQSVDRVLVDYDVAYDLLMKRCEVRRRLFNIQGVADEEQFIAYFVNRAQLYLHPEDRDLQEAVRIIGDNLHPLDDYYDSDDEFADLGGAELAFAVRENLALPVIDRQRHFERHVKPRIWELVISGARIHQGDPETPDQSGANAVWQEEQLAMLQESFVEPLEDAFKGKEEFYGLLRASYRDVAVFNDDPNGKKVATILFPSGASDKELIARVKADEIKADDWQLLERLADGVDTSFWNRRSTTWRSLITYELSYLALLLDDAVEQGDGDSAAFIAKQMALLFVHQQKRAFDLTWLREKGLRPNDYNRRLMSRMVEVGLLATVSGELESESEPLQTGTERR